MAQYGSSNFNPTARNFGQGNRDYNTIGSASINLISDDFILGFPHEGRMSAIRRFFCLFVTFDVAFITLLWIISVVITGANIYDALREQVLHYTIYTSLFDVVVIAIIRFFVLIIFYAWIATSHWAIIALSTSGSCAFLISKVFLYDFAASKQPLFEVVLIIASFVLAWGEAWFLDGRVIPHERYAQSYINRLTQQYTERTPLFLPSTGNSESVANYYSPFASLRGSDDGEDKDNEYRQMGLDCVKTAYNLLEAKDWKLEKETPKGDKIYSTKREAMGKGKVYKLTGALKCSASALIYELFTKIEEMPLWNPTLLESKIVHKIDYFTDISYQATMGAGGGLVKSRDFVNLRCYRVVEDGVILAEQDTKSKSAGQRPARKPSLSTVNEQSEGEGSSVKSEATSSVLNESYQTQAYGSVGNSISGCNFSGVGDYEQQKLPRGINIMAVEEEEDAFQECEKMNRVYVSAAMSINYAGYPPCTKYERGENIISCFATRDVPGHPNECLFEWLMCIDLKGYIMASVLDTAFKKSMQDYMICLRKHFEDRS